MQDTELERRLIGLVRADAALMAQLAAVRALALPDWFIGAGAVRNLVWDALAREAAPSQRADVDVVYFDAADLSTGRDAALQRRLAQSHPGVAWEVTNQAGVHCWYEQHFGQAVAPLTSMAEGVASWPEFATAVGVSLDADGTLRVIAPHGLDDLFAMVVRHNPARVSVNAYRQRLAQKRFAQRWPGVTVIPA